MICYLRYANSIAAAEILQAHAECKRQLFGGSSTAKWREPGSKGIDARLRAPRDGLQASPISCSLISIDYGRSPGPSAHYRSSTRARPTRTTKQVRT